MPACTLLLTLALSSAASAHDWSAEIIHRSTAGVSFSDLHDLDASRIVDCDLLVECETAAVSAPSAPKVRSNAVVPVAPDKLVIVRGSVRTEQEVVETKQCASFIQGRLKVRYFSPLTRLYYADAQACEAATPAATEAR